MTRAYGATRPKVEYSGGMRLLFARLRARLADKACLTCGSILQHQQDGRAVHFGACLA